jgi:hypothetical protein
MTAALWYFSYRRPSNLVKDPASIADVMSLIQSDYTPSCDHQLNGTSTFDRSIPSRAFRLGDVHVDGKKRVHLISETSNDYEWSLGREALTIPSKPVSDEPCKVDRPLELKLSAGMVFIGVILLALATLNFLETWSSRKKWYDSRVTLMQA